MSLASTVRSVIEVPATHSSGVELIWPAWTDAISSSVEAKTVPPTERMNASFGWATLDGWSSSNPTTASTTTPAIAASRRRGAPDEREPHADGCIHGRQQDHDPGRADGRHQEERDEEAAGDRAERVRGEERPRLRARGRCLVAQQRRRGRERDAEDDRDGQHDEQRAAEQHSERLDRVAQG